MCKLTINGGKKLFGHICIQGSKNASLPILAATLLTKSECIIHNCPDIADTSWAFEILKALGCEVYVNKNDVCVKAQTMTKSIIKKELMEKMRSSVMFLGAMLSRNKEACICRPGGCRLGERPIDIHISALKSLGAEIIENGECINCKLKKIKNERIVLLYPSVGATENIMLACAVSDVVCEIINPAREPEIEDLQNFLNAMGADISGAGGNRIIIKGVSELHGCEYTVMPDRIVASTYLLAAAGCGGEVELEGVKKDDIDLVTEILKKTGCTLKTGNNYISVKGNGKHKNLPEVRTLPYPGFPTDVQPLLSAYLSTADGVSVIHETIFDGRFGYVNELIKLGAKIKCFNNFSIITGVDKLCGKAVSAADLRGGAALVIGGLLAEGTTEVFGVNYIDRGYENIEGTLTLLGADIARTI